jgi:hypothetical protein
VDFENADKAIKWLNLSSYDYGSHNDILFPEKENPEILCRGLIKMEGKYTFKRGFIEYYNSDK